MEAAVFNAIARIEVMQGSTCISRGTGFLAADGLVLTAMHVVANRDTGAPHYGEIVLHFPHGDVPASIHPGCWDAADDWLLLDCPMPPDTQPIPLAELKEDGVEWQTFGFPDDMPEGLANGGKVRIRAGQYQGRPAVQLFGDEASAGLGERVKGLSGAPVLVRDAVVGILRAATLEDDHSVAGTLFACPLAAVLKNEIAGNLLPKPDPCFGLPGLPRRPLPDKPFRHLAWFTEKEAEIFFGRNQEIADIYHSLTDHDASPVLLLYGQAGVGKSSILDAGVRPRLSWSYDVRYGRRAATRPLLDVLRELLKTEPAADLATAWRAAEQQGGKRLIVILDQIEEVFTRPNPEAPQEIEDLTRALAAVFNGPNAPRGRIAFSFRKEWFPELQKQMEMNELDYAKVFLESLNRAGVLEAIAGVTQSPRLQKFYHLDIQTGVAEQIAADLMADRESPLAPTLQILLTKMWERASAESSTAPAFTLDLYLELKNEGIALGDFLDQQLAALKAIDTEWVDSGLALDVLTYHTTALASSRERTPADLLANYEHRAEILPSLVQELQNLYLLTDSLQNGARKTTRLSHDTLALPVRQRFARSERSGQRARRIIENRIDEWREGTETGLLDEASLAIVEHGAAGMRRLDEAETKLLDASRVRLWRARQAARVRQLTDDSQRLMESDPPKALALAAAAVLRSRQAGRIIPMAQLVLLRAIQEVSEIHFRAGGCRLSGQIVWAGESIFVVQQEQEVGVTLRRWSPFDPGSTDLYPPFVPNGAQAFSLRSTRDGNLLALGHNGGIILLDRDGNVETEIQDEDGYVTAFTPDSRDPFIVTFRNDGRLHARNRKGELLWDVEASKPRGERDLAYRAVASEFDAYRDGQLVIVTAAWDGVIRVWDREGKLLEEIPGIRPGLALTSLDLSTAGDGVTMIVAASQYTRSVLAVAGRWRSEFLLPGYCQGLRISPANHLVAVALDDGTVHFVNPHTGAEPIPPVRGLGPGGTEIAFHPLGRCVAIHEPVNCVTRVLDTTPGPEFTSLESNTELQDPCPAPLFLSEGFCVALRDWIIVWTPADRSDIKTPERAEIQLLAISPDKRRLAAADNQHFIRLWSVDGHALGEIRLDADWSPHQLCFTADGLEVLIATWPGRDQRIECWNPGSGQIRRLWPPSDDSPKRFFHAFSPDGSRFVTGLDGEGPTYTVEVWATRSPEAPLYNLLFDGSVKPAFAPDGETIVLTSGRHIAFWRRGEPATAPVFGDLGAEVVHGPVLHPNGELIYAVTGAKDRIGIFDRETLERIGDFHADSVVMGLSQVSADGKTIASIQKNGSTRIWLATWRQHLDLACERLRHHPVPNNDGVSDPLELEELEMVRQACDDSLRRENFPFSSAFAIE